MLIAILIFPQSSRHIDDVAVNVTVLANGVNLKKDKIYVDTYYDSSNLTSEGGREDRGNMEVHMHQYYHKDVAAIEIAVAKAANI
ncbi:hypothetical protein RclHR1_09350007 [Rhizophagus clarus]|uniref:Uncharacterized protein n=1 Tax=Rhizophagus clarus TaxID=94130 RepID=A0A2Z6SHF5_9GLOM|nr:hypothetical protein RclHR1_09350007 [Rhizophagus clarus]